MQETGTVWHRFRAADIASEEGFGNQKWPSSVPGRVRSRLTQFPSFSDMRFAEVNAKHEVPPGSGSVAPTDRN